MNQSDQALLWDDSPSVHDVGRWFLRCCDIAIQNGMPYMAPSLATARSEFAALRESRFVFDGGTIAYSLAGQRASDHFAFNERMRCAGYDLPSPVEAWRSAALDRESAIARKMLMCAMRLARKQPTNDRLARAVTRLSGACYQAAQFRPSAALSLFRAFEPRVVLDPSAGWGDRMVAALACDSVKAYIGIDPNKSMHSAYAGIAKEFGRGRSVQMICSGAERVEIEAGSVDVVFTSPPYWDTERYSPDDPSGQSWALFPRFADWSEGFLRLLIGMSAMALRRGGVLALNVQDKVNRKTGEVSCIVSECQRHALAEGLVARPILRLAMKSKPGNRSRSAPPAGSWKFEPVLVWVKP